MFHVPEGNRVTEGKFGSSIADGNNGAFIIHQAKSGFYFQCIASDGLGWEHVSVTMRYKNNNLYNIPTWEEMCFIKSVFWDKEDTVMQLHPKESEYVNNHPFVLHLWRPTDKEILVPDPILVGIK